MESATFDRAPASSRHPAAQAASALPRLVVVGGGMAAHGLCARMLRNGSLANQQVTLFGDEPQPAYDRVKLSSMFEGRTADDLTLADADWYRQNHIKLNTGCRITGIDRTRREVTDQTGRRHRYDRLILSTGSSAFVPPLPGTNLPGVFVYRTLTDLQRIEDYLRDRGATSGAVIGGGLLGLEAARVLVARGITTDVIEMAPGLMPRQLDAKAAALLRQEVEATGVRVNLVRRTKRIARQPDGRLRISFENAETLDVDLLIIAAGVRPNDGLARQCGLEVGPRGGIAVDDRLQTSDPAIHAIGECASFRGHVYGLVAPCYRMADVLAMRLAGHDVRFEGADESAELKLLGVKVAALGRAIGESRGGVTLIQQDEKGYRKLILEQGRVVGAACVGPWAELPQIRTAIHQQTRLWPSQRARFRKTGSPWAPGGAMPVDQWPGDSVVCACLGVTKGTLQAAIEEGERDPQRLALKTGASTACGSCRSLVCELAGETAPATAKQGTTVMLVASVAALLIGVLMLLLPPLPIARSVRSGWRAIDLLWRTDLARQVTGFTLLGLLLAGLVFSLRKRTSWFRWGSYRFWRAAHGALGAGVLVAMAVHTGIRLGDNLNFVLGSLFLATALLGAAAGILSGLEGRVGSHWEFRLREWRPRLTRVHQILFWPLPALIAIHIVSFYWFSD